MELDLEEMKPYVKTVVNREFETRKAATQGGKYRLKRHPFVSLHEKGLLDEEKLLKEFHLVQTKKSSLSASERAVINQIVFMAMQLAAEAKFAKQQEAEESHE